MKSVSKTAGDSRAQAMRAVSGAFANSTSRQAKNPVMLMVYVSAILTTVLFHFEPCLAWRIRSPAIFARSPWSCG